MQAKACHSRRRDELARPLVTLLSYPCLSDSISHAPLLFFQSGAGGLIGRPDSPGDWEGDGVGRTLHPQKGITAGDSNA
ncbi:MAG TPA: hypothetical protein VMY06_13445 [Sedimentisphaerales bacterium]|nr:hypothetical protein [Sedimentisphaerales bacterium]